jgi:nitrate/TMAO reductase-like tetraheme cytochrome c subunit
MLLIIFLLPKRQTDSPHGTGFTVSCDKCHSTDGWKFDKSIYSFDHNTTKLPLTGQHSEINCRECHPTLVFSDAKTECIDCHTDMHQQTTGSDCSRCHTPVSWLVNNISEIHQMGRFPLLGAHKTADCIQCHQSESQLVFTILGVECIDCHREDYMATTEPNHIQAGFSEDCAYCHSMNAFQWSSSGFNHSFFPLTLGHSNVACIECHTDGNYTAVSSDCFSCHQADYDATTNPAHLALGFSTSCTACHTTNPGWQPASFTEHDSQSFPIYSGSHQGEWDACTDCHTDVSDYGLFSCLNCHEHNQADMDDEHRGEDGYSYNSAECYRCHPRGNEN